MFYLSVHLMEACAHVVVVKKEFYSGRRRYHVAFAKRLEAESSEITSALLDMRLDDRWRVVKKVFSQSGRPPRIKEEPPLILLSSFDDGLHMAEFLRRRCASVEVIFCRDPGPEVREKLKSRAFDNCHVVGKEAVYGAMGRACARGSLALNELSQEYSPDLWPIFRALVRSPEVLPSFNGATPWFCALGHSIWHGETLWRVKRY